VDEAEEAIAAEEVDEESAELDELAEEAPPHDGDADGDSDPSETSEADSTPT